MYCRAQFERYAEQIENASEKEEFQRIVATIRFNTWGLCGGAIPQEAFSGSSVDHLRADFENRHLEFLHETDLPQFRHYLN
ncbi:hypothetical protein HZA87_00585 [Candidatus Uhrbacteria bacterium]|nr:hypothetical protein [Candidatus Uhrbacteria bacterium]